jgi:DNA-directed RNA polymerase II subunit RPB7
MLYAILLCFVLTGLRIRGAMFFLKEETKIVSLHPSYFGPNVKEYLVNRLNEEEEGRCTGDHFVICVMDMMDIGEGRVIPGSGHAEYTIKYRAIIWKPFRGETVGSYSSVACEFESRFRG